MGCTSDELDDFGDCQLINELEARGYEVVDPGYDGLEMHQLYLKYVSGKDVSTELIQYMLERANRII